VDGKTPASRRLDAMPETTAPSYLIVIERADDGGYGAWAPDLPGCVALGDSIEDAERQMREAIAFHLEGLREQGEPPPEPTAVAAVMVTTPAA
jgi:predicted RNase H-like HicB family nuclease